MPCHSNMLSVLALYLQLCSCESQFYMLAGTLCEEWDEGRANSFLTWIPLPVQSVFLHRCRLISSKLFHGLFWHPVMMSQIFVMTWSGEFWCQGVFIFWWYEEQEIKIRKRGEKKNLNDLLMQPAKRKSRRQIWSYKGKTLLWACSKISFLFLFFTVPP